MNLKIIKGNIFTTDSQTLVNPINCVGVMGAGIALEYRFRYPDMFKRYKTICDDKQMVIGKLWLFKPQDDRKWVLNFPTKKDWKYPSKPEYLKLGLEKFLHTYTQKGIRSIAFPLLGSAKGGISESLSLSIMQQYLERCDIPVDIYKYDAKAQDDLFLEFKAKFQELSDGQLADGINLRIDLVKKIRAATEKPGINSISQLASVKGIGLMSLEKSFRFLTATHTDNSPRIQNKLI